MSPSLFDEWVVESNNETSPGFNNVLRKAGAFLYDFAQEQGIDYIDVNTPALIIDQYNKQLSPGFTVLPDGCIKRACGLYDDVADFKSAGRNGARSRTVEADAAEGKISARNASVTDAAFSGDTVSFTYAPSRCQSRRTKTTATQKKLFPISSGINREIIRVGGLSDRMYTIKMDGTTTATVSAADLAAGCQHR